MTAGLTPQLPLQKYSESSYKLITKYEKLVRQNFKNLMLTVPGERVMDLDFGVGLRRFLFELDDIGVQMDVESIISVQAEKYLPYVEIKDISFKSLFNTPGLNNNALYIAITYEIKPLDKISTLELTLPVD